MRRPRITTGLALAITLGLACSEFGSPAGVDELIITDIKIGDGAQAVAGKSVAVHYTGWLYDPSAEQNRGNYFDGSRTRGLPFSFMVRPGSGGVIEGWHQGILGMKVGGIRELIIPPELAYGENSAAGGAIVPHSTLVFEVELVKIRN
ncbi:MAG: FKBP-type peptidyl-prolyl cis-trans isomerase [bacterium]|nr:FKBP-type peptidyl-prolyl cis-trans isomerase [bacterium]